MELKEKLYSDIKTFENDLNITQDEKAYDDKSDYYLLNRLAELRLISLQRKIISQGAELMKRDTRHDSEEVKNQIEIVKKQITDEVEKNKEYEFQYENFANVYLGQDNSIKGEMQKILNEYEMLGIYISREIIDKSDEYMFDNYALTEEKMRKANSDGDTGGRGMGLSMEQEDIME